MEKGEFSRFVKGYVATRSNVQAFLNVYCAEPFANPLVSRLEPSGRPRPPSGVQFRLLKHDPNGRQKQPEADQVLGLERLIED